VTYWTALISHRGILNRWKKLNHSAIYQERDFKFNPEVFSSSSKHGSLWVFPGRKIFQRGQGSSSFHPKIQGGI